MDYKKLTKAELIAQLEAVVPLEKYDRILKKLEIKDNRIADLESKLSTVTEKLDNLNVEHTQKVKEAKVSSESVVARAKQEYEIMKENYEYVDEMAKNEYELAKLIYDKNKQEQEFSDKLFKLYHKTIFKENE